MYKTSTVKTTKHTEIKDLNKQKDNHVHGLEDSLFLRSSFLSQINLQISCNSNQKSRIFL